MTGDGGAQWPGIGIEPVSIDELSTVRYVHAQAIRAAAASWGVEDDPAAYAGHVHTATYADQLIEAIRHQRLAGGYIDRQLIATCGWSPDADEPFTVRLRWCHVLPLFGRQGFGTALLSHIETEVSAAGYAVVSARADRRVAAFFEACGYAVTAHGTQPVVGGRSMPQTYLRKAIGPSATERLF